MEPISPDDNQPMNDPPFDELRTSEPDRKSESRELGPWQYSLKSLFGLTTASAVVAWFIHLAMDPNNRQPLLQLAAFAIIALLALIPILGVVSIVKNNGNLEKLLWFRVVNKMSGLLFVLLFVGGGAALLLGLLEFFRQLGGSKP